MKFAREGVPFIAIAAILAVTATVVAATAPPGTRRTLVTPVAGAAIALTLWIAWFFRDPERTGPRGDHLVIAPADGLVLPIETVAEPAWMGADSLRVSIFMNIFDVHVNRYPVSGTVGYVHYNRGRFLHAAHEKASLDNEQSSVGMSAGTRRVLVRQIAGLIARRIVTYAREGNVVRQGDRMGLIRFGSRVDVFLPPTATVRARPGQRVRAGESVLAELTA